MNGMGGASHVNGLDVEPVLVAATVHGGVVRQLALLVDERRLMLADE